MKKNLNFLKVTSFLVLSIMLLSTCTEDQQNKISRLGVTFFEGDYEVTFASGVHTKTWFVFGEKITSDVAKGYYYFWITESDGQKRYVQTPIARTYIEEIKK